MLLAATAEVARIVRFGGDRAVDGEEPSMEKKREGSEEREEGREVEAGDDLGVTVERPVESRPVETIEQDPGWSAKTHMALDDEVGNSVGEEIVAAERKVGKRKDSPFGGCLEEQEGLSSRKKKKKRKKGALGEIDDLFSGLI